MASDLTITVGVSTWRLVLVLRLLNLAAWLGLHPREVQPVTKHVKPRRGEDIRVQVSARVIWR